MIHYIRFAIPVLAIMLVSCSTQRYTGNDRNNGSYGNILSKDDRDYGEHGYNSGTDWYELDKVRLAPGKESKRIKVTRREGKNVSRLLLRTNGPVHLQRVVVTYSNGRTEELDLRNTSFDTRRRNSDLNDDMIVRVPNYDRARLREIVFWYDVKNRPIFGKRPTVFVFAK